MDRTKWVERLKQRLGYPVVSISTPDATIQDFVAQACEKIIPYARVTELIPGVGPVIDLRDKKILTIIRILPATAILSAPVTGVIDPFYTVNLWPTTGMQHRLVEILSMNLYRTELEAAIPKDWEFHDGFLYTSGFTSELTVEALTERSVDNQPETYQQWCFDYALALLKISEGEIRSKIKLPNSPVEMNGEQLKSEGITEKADLEHRLGRELGILFATR